MFVSIGSDIRNTSTSIGDVTDVVFVSIASDTRSTSLKVGCTIDVAFVSIRRDTRNTSICAVAVVLIGNCTRNTSRY